MATTIIADRRGFEKNTSGRKWHVIGYGKTQYFGYDRDTAFRIFAKVAGRELTKEEQQELARSRDDYRVDA